MTTTSTAQGDSVADARHVAHQLRIAHNVALVGLGVELGDVIRSMSFGVERVFAAFDYDEALFSIDIMINGGVAWTVHRDGRVEPSVDALPVMDHDHAVKQAYLGSIVGLFADPRIRPEQTSRPLARVLEALRLAVQ